MRTIGRILGMTAMLLSLHATSYAQETPYASVPGQPIELSISELSVVNYTPKTPYAADLYNMLQNMASRDIYIKERGGPISSPPIRNMSFFIDQIILYDTEAYIAQVLETLEKLDRPLSEESSTNEEEKIGIDYYQPRFISLEAALDALKPLKRTVIASGEHRPSVTYVEQRNLIILRGTQESLGQMNALLDRVDVPEDQVILTCYLLQSFHKDDLESDEGAAPAELTENLRNILPDHNFETVGFSLLRTSLSPGREITLRVSGAGGAYQLSFQPAALSLIHI